jgi:hypothetical protein
MAVGVQLVLPLVQSGDAAQIDHARSVAPGEAQPTSLRIHLSTGFT